MSNSLFTLAQSNSGGAGGAIAAVFGIIFFLLYIGLIVLIVAGIWKTFVKAGQPGWAAIVPFYNMYIMCKIAGRPGWWVLLMLIPLVGAIVAILVMIDFAKSFGKDVLYGLGLAFLGFIFFPILGFGKSQYQGPAAAK